MNVSSIMKLASYFELLTKKATLRGNMAKRMMFNLLSHLVPEGEQARIYYTKGIVDYTALKSLIPGVKEFLKYGILVVLEELENFPHDQDYDQIQSAYKNNDLESALSLLKRSFAKSSWQNYGGEVWVRISNHLLEIHRLLSLAESVKNKEPELYYQYLMEMIVQLDVLEGIMHNTGSFMTKMIFQERKENPAIDYNIGDLSRLGDTKELKDPHETLHQILPILERETDAPLTMKDWMRRARYLQKNQPADPAVIEEKIKRIHAKKDFIRYFREEGLLIMQQEINKFLSMPDSKIEKELKKIQPEKIVSLMKILKDNTFVSDDLRNQLSRQIALANTYSIEKLKEYLSQNKYYYARKILNHYLILISLIEKAIQSMEDIR